MQSVISLLILSLNVLARVVFSAVSNALKKADIPYVLFDGANSEPTDKIVDAGLAVYRNPEVVRDPRILAGGLLDCPFDGR